MPSSTPLYRLLLLGSRLNGGMVLGIFLAAAAMVGAYAPLAMAPLAGLTAMALGVVCLARLRPYFPMHLAALLGLAHLWQMVSLLWAIDPAHAARTLAQIVSLSMAGLVIVAAARSLDAAERRQTLQWSLIGLAFGLTLSTGELFLGASVREWMWQTLYGQPYPEPVLPQRLNRTLTIHMLLALPVFLGLWREGRRRLAFSLLTAAVIPVIFSVSLAAKIALVGALLAGALAALCGRWVPKAITIGAVLLIAATPFLAQAIPSPEGAWQLWPSIPNSSHHRLTIWSFSGARIGEHPWIGWGMDAARDIPGGENIVVTHAPASRGGYVLNEQVMPLHPHNLGVQHWMELGTVGALLLMLFLAALGWWMAAAPSALMVLGSALYFAVFAVAEISFGAWQAWWIGTIWLTAGLALTLGQGPSRRA